MVHNMSLLNRNVEGVSSQGLDLERRGANRVYGKEECCLKLTSACKFNHIDESLWAL